MNILFLCLKKCLYDNNKLAQQYTNSLLGMNSKSNSQAKDWENYLGNWAHFYPNHVCILSRSIFIPKKIWLHVSLYHVRKQKLWIQFNKIFIKYLLCAIHYNGHKNEPDTFFKTLTFLQRRPQEHKLLLTKYYIKLLLTKYTSSSCMLFFPWHLLIFFSLFPQQVNYIRL